MQKCALPFIHRYIKTDLYRGNVVDSNQAITSLEIGSFCASGIALLKRFTGTLSLSSEDIYTCWWHHHIHVSKLAYRFKRVNFEILLDQRTVVTIRLQDVKDSIRTIYKTVLQIGYDD